jgi:hypothetical protein
MLYLTLTKLYNTSHNARRKLLTIAKDCVKHFESLQASAEGLGKSEDLHC